MGIENYERTTKIINDYWNRLSPKLRESIRLREERESRLNHFTKEYVNGSIDVFTAATAAKVNPLEIVHHVVQRRLKKHF